MLLWRGVVCGQLEIKRAQPRWGEYGLYVVLGVCDIADAGLSRSLRRHIVLVAVEAQV